MGGPPVRPRDLKIVSFLAIELSCCTMNRASFSLAVMACAAAVSVAQYHPDPFSGSGCNCSSFCDGHCAINASKPTNLTGTERRSLALSLSAPHHTDPLATSRRAMR